MFAVRTLEFDRIVADVAGLSLTPLGRARLEVAKPATELRDVVALQHGTSETVTFFEQNSAFPLRAGPGLVESLASLGIEGRPLDPLSLRTLAEFVDSVERSRAGIQAAKGSFPLLNAIVSQLASFKAEVTAVRDAIDVSGEVLDNASPALRGIRDRLRQLRQKLRQHARTVRPRQGHVEVPAGRGHHGTERPLRAAGARRAPWQRAGHRPRQLRQRRQPVPRAGRHRRNQQRHRRTRGAGA